MTTIGAAWRRLRDRFRDAKIDRPEVDAHFLAEAVFEMTHSDLLRHELGPVTVAQERRLDEFGSRRLSGEPIARILGEKAFYGRMFRVNGATLVPRPETELLVTLAHRALMNHPHPLILDLGTGTGCIAISLLADLPRAQAVAIDLSVDALTMARLNAVTHKVDDRLSLSAGSWFDPLEPGERFDVIVSNPPYVESDVIPTLMPEVKDHDPMLALDGGADGLAAYRIILAGARERLNLGGMLIVEIASTQGAAVSELARASGFVTITLEKDLAGLDRAVLLHHL